MPIYKYVCKECGAEYEKLRPIDNRYISVRCSSCGGEAVFRMAVPARFQRGTYWSLGEQEDMPGEV